MTPQELKASILQLAIQGKLVEQRPEEGTGEELLEKILAAKDEKATKKNSRAETRIPQPKAVREADALAGVRRRGKTDAASPREELPDSEKPFDIPESWEWVRLGEVGSWGSGATPSRTHAEYFGGSVPWLKTGDLNDGYVSSIPETITDLALEETSVRLNPVGSVLMAMYGATIGKLGILQIAATTNQACCACIPYDGVWNKYLFYYLMARRKAFIKMGEGGAQPNISKEKIVNALIPLPPLAEQKRIVAKIEELLPYIDRYEKAWSKLEDFNKRFPGDMQKSLLQMAIQGKLVDQRPEEGTGEELYRQIQSEKQRLVKSGKIKKEKPLPEITPDEIPFDIPANWKWVSVGSVCTNIQYGSSQKSSPIGKIPVLRMGNIQDGRVVYDKLVYTSDDSEIAKYHLAKNDLLFNRTNSKELVGKTAIYKGEMPAIYAGYLVRISPIGLDSDYLNYVMQSKYYWTYCQTVRSDAIGQSNINAEKLKRFQFPLPPLAEQNRIVAKLEELLPLCERLKGKGLA